MPTKYQITGLLVALSYLILFFIVLVVATVFGLRRVPDSAQEKENSLINVFDKQPVSQTIIPYNDGLNTVLIYLKNSSLKNSSPFNFYLIDAKGEYIRTVNINGKNIGDGQTVRFQFSPVADSAGKKYLIQLTAPSTGLNQDPIQVGFSKDDTYSLGSGFIGNASDSGDMSFQLFYRPQNNSVLIGELSQNFFKRLFSFRFILLVSLSFVLFSWYLSRLTKSTNS